MDKEFKNLEKDLLKHSKKLGWKSVYFFVVKFQKKHYPDSGYNFTSEQIKQIFGK